MAEPLRVRVAVGGSKVAVIPAVTSVVNKVSPDWSKIPLNCATAECKNCESTSSMVDWEETTKTFVFPSSKVVVNPVPGAGPFRSRMGGSFTAEKVIKALTDGLEREPSLAVNSITRPPTSWSNWSVSTYVLM